MRPKTETGAAIPAIWQGLDDFVRRVGARLDSPAGPARLGETGDMDFLNADEQATLRPAAVLIGILPHATGPTALLTVRPDTMADHAGQVAFPGGKIDPCDADAIAAALREAEEEVGLPAAKVTVLGCGAPYVTGSRYRITPVIGLIAPGFIASNASQEVAAVFETPLSVLMGPDHHRLGEAHYKGKPRRYYEIPWQGYRIWGVTAGIIRSLHETLYTD
jgi:8-oxo-dGTP pyrophosphatase MutT (NUDIX family)